LLYHINPRLKVNNFDLLRVFFAMTVCLVHTYELSGFVQLTWIVKILSSEVAVKGFFVVSGFLIFMSYERSTSFQSYAGKRVRRIYPAYFTVVMACALGLVTISSNTIDHYFSFAWFKYIAANLSFLNFLQPALPEVFDSNKLVIVNGALWTLKIEVLFYLTVPLFSFLFRRYSTLAVIVLAYCISVAYSEYMINMAEQADSQLYKTLSRQLPGQLSYFMSGAFLYYFLQFFERNIRYFVPVAAFVLAADHIFPLPLLEPFALATAVVFFGLFLYVGNFGKYGDFSYGIYILHFPIIQLIIYFGWFKKSPWPFLILVVFLTTIGSIALWHLVEKKFLLRRSHYIEATESAEDENSDQLPILTKKS